MKNFYFIHSITLVIFLGIISSCENDLKDIQAIDKVTDNVDRYKNIKLTYSDSAQMRVIISAPEMESHFIGKSNQEDRFPIGVHVEFYDDAGVPSSWLTAKQATRYPSKKMVVVRDSVTLLSVQGDTFSTEELFWNQKDGSIYTEGYFRYVSADKILTGRKFKSDQNFKEYTFENTSGVIEANLP